MSDLELAAQEATRRAAGGGAADASAADRSTAEGAPPNLTTVLKGTFGTEAELNAWMQEHGVDTSGWGKGKAKTVANLFKEIESKVPRLPRSNGPKHGHRALALPRGSWPHPLLLPPAPPPVQESTLQLLGGQVYRCLAVVKLVVRQPGKMHRHLACYAQMMADGRKRERNVLVSEKMNEGEVPHIAALRGLTEEFSSIVDKEQIDLWPDSLLVWVEIIESPSFPNLTTQYRMHQMTATIAGLPHGSFSTLEEEVGKDGQVKTKEHFWEWRLDHPADLRRKGEGEPISPASPAKRPPHHPTAGGCPG